MPVAAVALAIGGSFASQASEKKVNTSVLAYIDAPDACHIVTSCSDVVNTVCTATVYSGTNVYYFQAYGKVSPSATTCPVILYQP